MACHYDTVIGEILDRLIPKCSVTCRRRSSDPWFDHECREAKRRVRRLERAASRAAASATSSTATSAAAAKSAWMAERCAYRDLLQIKHKSIWQSKINAERSSPHQLWQSINVLMGRGRASPSDKTGAHKLQQFFDDKVAGVHVSTAEGFGIDAVYLDYRKAFDPVPHKRLLVTLNYGFHNKMILWIKNFLEE